MQILSIQLRNIKSHRETELHFSSGINILSGPNGVGKSTVFEAIGYALFGVDAQSFVGNVDRFISIGAKRGEIAVVFQPSEEETFRVTRTVGTPSRWLLAREVAGAFEVEEHKDNKETETRLKELLGLDNGRPLSEQFTQVIGPFQNEFLGPFVIRQSTRRQEAFDSILGIDSWRKTFTETNSLHKAIKGKIDVLQAEIGSRQEQVAMLPEKKAELQTAKGDSDLTQKELERQQSSLSALETQLTGMDQQEQALTTLRGEIEKLGERIAAGKGMITAQKERIGESEKAVETVAETAAAKEAFELAEVSLAQLREQEKEKRRLEEEANRLDKQVIALGERYGAEERDVERICTELTTEEQLLAERKKGLSADAATKTLAARLPEVRAAIDALRKQIGELKGRQDGLEEGREKLSEGICPFLKEPCGNIADQPLQDLFSVKFAELDADRHCLLNKIEELEREEITARKAGDQLKALEVQHRELDQQVLKLATRRNENKNRAESLKELQKEQAAVQLQLDVKRQTLKGYNRLDADIEAANQEKRKHQEVRDLYVANQKVAADLEKRQAELQKFEKLLKELEGELASKQSDLKAVGAAYNSEAHAALRRQKDELREALGVLRQKIVGLGDTVARLSDEVARLEQIEKEIAQKQDQVKSYGKKEELVKFLRNRVFKQVSGQLSERFREEISLRANRIYRTISEADEELIWGDDYRIVLRDLANGEVRERTDDQLSGGQTMSAVVALRLALLQTIGARVAFFDEPTSNLDASRRENLAHAFRAIDVGREEVTEHWYDQLFLISHDVAFTEITDQMIRLGE